MKIIDLFQRPEKLFSFELFPPKRDGNLEALFETVKVLRGLAPGYISITYGAGGSTRDMTYDIALRLKDLGITPLVHFTCVGHSRAEIRQLLGRLRDAGIENLLALRGDPPKGQTAFTPAPDGFLHANELVAFIRAEGFDFCLGVAGYPETHPEAEGPEQDLANLKRKIDAGGQFVVTQLFFDNRDYFAYVEDLRARGVTVPVQPGVWLLTDHAQIERFQALSGAKVPPDLAAEALRLKDDKQAVTDLGVAYATRQCAELLQKGAPGIHFYVMNRSHSVERVLANLRQMGLRP